MKLKKIINGISFEEIKGPKEIEITGVCSHSKFVNPGNLFIAKGEGAEYIPQVVQSGASAIVTDLYNPFFSDVTQLIHPDPKQIEAMLANNFYDYPSRKLKMIGVTGTNGKTTTSYIVKHLLESLGVQCGLLGTIAYHIGTQELSSHLTTPDIVYTTKLLSEMVANGLTACVMEVSSHALDQGRVEGILFDVGIFTNLSQEHLDYHGSMEKYLEAKKKLFVSSKHAVINKDDGSFLEIAKACKSSPLFYSIQDEESKNTKNNSACSSELVAKDCHLSQQMTEFTFQYEKTVMSMESPLIGKFNVSNVLAAIGALIALGLPLENLERGIQTLAPIPGRFEKIGKNVIVDFAHSNDSLENTLKALSQIKQGKVISVFGCGGNRDVGKRKLMAEVSEKYADYTIVTNDNPRQEDPQKIAQDILVGLKDRSRYHVELDRKKAIFDALKMASSTDIILLAGKGHEAYQLLKNKSIPFDDREIVKECLSKMAATST